ncbi:MAG: hypothetical protein ACKOJF_23515, partial [Planctomycetaceae bacterium]
DAKTRHVQSSLAGFEDVLSTRDLVSHVTVRGDPASGAPHDTAHSRRLITHPTPTSPLPGGLKADLVGPSLPP